MKELIAYFIILVIFCGYALGEAPLILSLPDTKILEKPIRAELVFKIGSDKANEDFYHLRSFTVDKKGQIYILDAGNSRIQCFSKEGKFLFGFGGQGQGPGELSNDTSKIKILSDENIYVIDNLQRRINVYNLEGQFLFSARTSAWYNDIELLNNTYYLSGFRLEENYKPIHICRTLGKIDEEFGILVEPTVGILQQINQLRFPQPWRIGYSRYNFTNIIVTNKNEIVFSQDYPYRLIKYDAKGQVLKDIMGDVDFDTYAHDKITAEKGVVSLSTSKPARILDVSIKNDNQVVVPYLDLEKNFFYIDIYDLDLNLVSRYKMPNIFADAGKEESIDQGVIDNDDNLYATVKSEETYPQLVKYKLIFD
jgi:hypothetical protein